MTKSADSELRIARIEERSIVSLTLVHAVVDTARDRLALAAPLQATRADPSSLWVGPEHWLLVSGEQPVDILLERCNKALGDILHIAVDQSSGLAVFRLEGYGARALLAAGSGVDFRPGGFKVNDCCRTRLARIAVIIVALDRNTFDVYVDSSYANYLHRWLDDEALAPDLPAAGGCQ